MKKILFAASAIGLLASTSAMAAENQVDLSGTVAAACGVGNHISGPGTAAGFTEGDISGIAIADGNGQFNTPVQFDNRSFGNLWCNAPATVTLEVTDFSTDVTVYDTGSFTNRFDVEVQTDAGVYIGQGQDYVLSTAGNASASQSGSTAGAFETGTGRFGGADYIKILPAARSSGGNYRPVAGNYTGYVRLTATTS